MENKKIAEYQSLQHEITERGKILHGILNLATIFIFFSLAVFFFLFALGIDQNTLKLYLLCLPPIFAFLSFNYQANGFTLEVIMKYTEVLINKKKPNPLNWRPYFIKHKNEQRLIAFAKTLPLVFPQFVPIFMLVFGQLVLSTLLFKLIFAIDIILLILTIVNFRYKLIYLK